ncbi:hypothetical protein BD779DRAFT_1680694 [Infundibulicybe gibba]|nr:hypothetical protein BD779DRAFT_1680694 [Infundibulicybe gibba]
MSTSEDPRQNAGLTPLHSVGFPLRTPQDNISPPALRPFPIARTPMIILDPALEAEESTQPGQPSDTTPETLPPPDIQPGNSPSLSGRIPPPETVRIVYPETPLPLDIQSNNSPSLAGRTSPTATKTIKLVYPETSPSPSEEIPIDFGIVPGRLPRASPAEGEPGAGDAGRRRRASRVSPPPPSPSPRKYYLFGPDQQDNIRGFDTGSSPSPPPDPPLHSPSPKQPPHIPQPASSDDTVDPFFAPPTTQDDQPFCGRGWTEYPLPDESVYYVHPVRQLVADIDLRDAKLLGAISTYVEEHCNDPVAHNQELWLWDAGSHEDEFRPLRCWVNHREQSVTVDLSYQAVGGSGDPHSPQSRGGDRLDAKYRYWSFMEAHPAHTSLPQNAQQEAIVMHSPPAPFTRDEFQELKTLLQSFEQERATKGEPNALHTLVVSKIALKMVRWRQLHFRPHKALPTDVGARWSGPHSPSVPESGGASTSGKVAPNPPVASTVGANHTICRWIGGCGGAREYIVLGFVTGACTCVIVASIAGPPPIFVRAAVIGTILSVMGSNTAALLSYARTCSKVGL